MKIASKCLALALLATACGGSPAKKSGSTSPSVPVSDGQPTPGGGQNGDGAPPGGSDGAGPAVLAAASDPVTQAMSGSHATYDVGPGKTYEDPDKVPWGALVAGDVV